MCRVRVFDAFDATITIEMDYLPITIQCNGWMGGIWEQKNWAERQLLKRFSKLNWVIFFRESFINHMCLIAVISMNNVSN